MSTEQNESMAAQQARCVHDRPKAAERGGNAGQKHKAGGVAQFRGSLQISRPCLRRWNGAESPFGSRYPGNPGLDVDALPVHSAPKLLGTYESEIHASIEAAIDRDPQVVINVGCAEGYYCVGLAMRLPGKSVYAFDADPKARKATMKNASLNGVAAQLQVSGAIRTAHLEGFLRLGKALVVMDCEGGEFDLLDLKAAPSLANADIIVELHPHRRPDIEEAIMARFHSTHATERIVQEPVEAKLAKAPSLLDLAERRTAVNERRSRDICWMFLRAAS